MDFICNSFWQNRCRYLLLKPLVFHWDVRFWTLLNKGRHHVIVSHKTTLCFLWKKRLVIRVESMLCWGLGDWFKNQILKRSQYVWNQALGNNRVALPAVVYRSEHLRVTEPRIFSSKSQQFYQDVFCTVQHCKAHAQTVLMVKPWMDIQSLPFQPLKLFSIHWGFINMPHGWKSNNEIKREIMSLVYFHPPELESPM